MIYVAEKNTTANLYLLMYSTVKTPDRLGKAFINIGENIPLSQFILAYSYRGTTRELGQKYYEKKENGDVCWK